MSEVLASDGALAAHYEYAPFGAVVAQRDASAASNPWRFSSEFAEDDTATVYYNYRHYEPMEGRWLSRDPLGETRGGLFVFVNNEVPNSTDRLGEDIWIENTTAAAGFHWSVCVDLWVPNKKGTCCRNGVRYARSQKFCISFGADSRFASSGSASSNSSSSKSASSSSSRSSSSSSENAESDSSWPQDSEFPEGFDESGDNGHVYVDDDYNLETGEWGNVKGIVDILWTDCNCDDRIYKYFVGLVGKGGKYNVFTQNCRDFSRMVFEKFRGECGK